MPATEQCQCFSEPCNYSEMEHIKLLSKQYSEERHWRGFLPRFPLTFERSQYIPLNSWLAGITLTRKRQLLSSLHVPSLEGQFAHQPALLLSAITVLTVNADKLKRSLYVVAYPWSLLQQRMVDCAWSTCYINRVWSLKDKKRAWIILYHTSGTFNISIWC